MTTALRAASGSSAENLFISLFEDVTDKEIERNILMNPFKRYEDIQMMRHTKTLGIVEVDNSVWNRLTEEEKTEIMEICGEKLEGYYRRLEGSR